ncbi:MAG: 1-(5-phosphoribosyl)-5-((5-phosphoribosylamino)methylideneamino)imidazole-4-carboxamide isomerase, partial [candidate division NC10 bacterium]|nr:1-(5-phosphoribosyl)-5-((5-phosphoribosylamino)methylideneamino)imidazole-4-carboxamide isomerase [candidate division NC10 bacterium]
MLIIPAIDLRHGRCVRLMQGDPERETVFSGDPIAVAQRFEKLGAKLLHVVDLNGAFSGFPQNLEVVRAMAKAVQIPIQLGGGIRDLETIKEV